MIPFEDDDDAVRIANDSQYGLSGVDHLRRPRAGQGRRPPDPHRHPRHQRRHLVRRRRAVRRLQAVGHRPPVRHRGPGDLHRDQDRRLARHERTPATGHPRHRSRQLDVHPVGRGSVLVDWGADVIKVEPMTGDPQRGLITSWGWCSTPATPSGSGCGSGFAGEDVIAEGDTVAERHAGRGHRGLRGRVGADRRHRRRPRPRRRRCPTPTAATSPSRSAGSRCT